MYIRMYKSRSLFPPTGVPANLTTRGSVDTVTDAQKDEWAVLSVASTVFTALAIGLEGE